MKYELPFEVWQNIFSFLPVEPGLRAVALTSRLFNTLSQRYLFNSLTVSVTLDDQEDALFMFKNVVPESFTNVCSRLAFYACPRIASEVQSCAFKSSLWNIQLFHRVRGGFLNALSQFHNLHNLELQGALIDAPFMERIAQLHPLRSITFRNCKSSSVSWEMTTRKIIADEVVIHLEDRLAVRWLSSIDPTTLKSLSLPTENATLEILEEAVLSGTLFPSLKTLTINGSIQVLISTTLKNALPFFPDLSNLRITSRTTSRPPPFTGMISLDDVPLQSWEGPHDILSTLQSQPSLRRVKLFGHRWERTCDMVTIKYHLEELQKAAPDVEALQIRAFPTTKLCKLITTSFPRLQSLCIYIPLSCPSTGDPMYGLTHEHFLPSIISITLPPQIQNLVVYMMFSDESEGRTVIETLTSRYPSLQHLYLHFEPNEWMTWIRTPPPGSRYPDPRKEGVDRGLVEFGALDVKCPWF